MQIIFGGYVSRIVKILGIVMCLSISIPVYAESAPVFDADTMQPDDNTAAAPGQAQDLPPSGQYNNGGAFVPGQDQVSVELPPSPPQMTQSDVDQRMHR